MKDFLLRPKVILWTLFVLLLFIVIMQNSEPTSLKLLFWSFAQMPKLVLILASMTLGSVITLIIVWQVTRSDEKPETKINPPGGYA